MSEMINDMLQNIYNRIAQMGQSISNLQQSLDKLNENLDSKIQALVDGVLKMKENQEKEGEAFKLVLESSGKDFLTELNRLKINIGLTDLEEMLDKLRKISETSAEALKPETVDVLLDEVLKGIKQIGRKKEE